MKKETLKTILFAAGTCIFMGGALLTGMHLYVATLQNTRLHEASGTETAEGTEDGPEEEDAAKEAFPVDLEGGEEDRNGREPDYGKIPVINSETEYHLTGYGFDDDGSPMEYEAEEEPRENEISRKDAALRGLKEIYRIFGEEHMEEMTLELNLYRDDEMEEQGKATESIWAGSLTFLDEWHKDADQAALTYNYYYHFEFSSVTGRWLCCQKRQMTRGENVFGKPEGKLTRGQRLDKAFDIIAGYDLLKLVFSSEELEEMELAGNKGVYGFYSSYGVEESDFYNEKDEGCLEYFYMVTFVGWEDGLCLYLLFDVETNSFVGFDVNRPGINLFT